MRDLPRPTRSITRALGAIAVFSLASCLGVSDLPEGLSILSVVGGNGQSVTADSAAAQPLVVLTLDQAAAPLPGVAVAWSITQGGGTLSSATSTSDANGIASVNYTAPATTGPVAVKATARDLAVTFTLTVVAQPPP